MKKLILGLVLLGALAAADDDFHSQRKCKQSAGDKASCKLDITVAIDMSWAMKSRDNVAKLANFTLEKVIDKYAFGKKHSRVSAQTLGTFTFSRSPYYDNYGQACQFIGRASDAVQIFGNIFYPLTKVYSTYLAFNVFPSSNKRVLVIFTAVNDPLNIAAAIPLSKIVRAKAKVIIVGINQKGKTYLDKLGDTVIYADLNDYSESIANTILDKTCPGSLPVTATSVPITTAGATTLKPTTTEIIMTTLGPEAPTTDLTTQEPSEPSTLAPEVPSTIEPSTMAPEEPSTVDPEAPTTGFPDIPSTNLPGISSTIAPGQQSTFEPEVPSTNSPNYLSSTIAPEEPSTPETETPSTHFPHESTTFATDVPSTEQPSEPSSQVPITEAPGNPSTIEPNEPSTAFPNEPSTSQPELSSSIQPEEPSTSGTAISSTVEPEESSTLSPNLSTTGLPSEPSTSEPNEVSTPAASPQTSQIPDASSSAEPQEPSTVFPENPSTSNPASFSTIEPIESSTLEPEDSTSVPSDEPTTKSTAGPEPTEDPHEPSTDLPEHSSTSAPESLSTEVPNEPSTTSEVDDPVTSQPTTGNPEPVTNDPTEDPSEASTQQPSEQPNESSTSVPEVSSTFEPVDPSTGEPENPETIQPSPEEPHTVNPHTESSESSPTPLSTEIPQGSTALHNEPTTVTSEETTTDVFDGVSTVGSEFTTTLANGQTTAPSISGSTSESSMASLPSEASTNQPETRPTTPSVQDPSTESSEGPEVSSIPTTAANIGPTTTATSQENPSETNPSTEASVNPNDQTTVEQASEATIPQAVASTGASTTSNFETGQPQVSTTIISDISSTPESDNPITKGQDSSTIPANIETTALPTTKNPLSDALGSSCSTNVTGAWLDIAFVIDISSASSTTSLNRFGGLVAGLFRRFTIDKTVDRSSRIAVITYGSEAAVQYDLESFENWSSLYTAFTTIGKFRQDKRDADISRGLQVAVDLLEAQKSHRIPTIVLVGADSDAATITVAKPVSDAIKNNGTKLVTINFATVASATEAPLNILASPNFGFVSTDPQLYSKLTAAFAKINCVCPKLTHQFETESEVFGDCVQGFNGQTPPDIAQMMCELSNGFLVSVTSEAKLTFLRTKVVKNEFGSNPEFTIGLHRVPTRDNKWFWFDYGSTVYPLGDFKDWANGKAPSDLSPCAYATREADDDDLGFAAGGCDFEDARPYLCQTKACDSEHMCDLDAGYKAASAHFRLQGELKQRMYRLKRRVL